MINIFISEYCGSNGLMINIFISEYCGSNGLNALRASALELIWRQPAASVDLVNGELPGEPLQQDPDENPENAPEYCKCRCCVANCNANTIGKQMLYTKKTALHITLALSSHS